MKKIVLIIALLIGLPLAGQPYAEYTPPLKQCYGDIIVLKFDQARALLAEQKKADPHNRVVDYLEAVMMSVTVFISDDKEYFESLEDQFDDRIERLEDLPDEEALKEFFLGEIHLARAILNGKYKNNFTAAYQFFKAYQALSANHSDFPDLSINKIPMGVLYAAIGSLPEDYRMLASMLGFEGDVQQGMALLKNGLTEIRRDPEWSFYTPYAGFIYAFTDFQLGNGQNLITPASLDLEVNSSSFLIYLQARILVKQGKIETALAYLNQRPRGRSYFSFPYLDYLEGKTALGLDNDRAERMFREYLRQAHGGIYLKSSYRYLSWIYLLNNDEAAFKTARANVLRYGNLQTGADRQALKEASSPLNKVLVEARILFDAAYYQKALDLLQQESVQSCCKTPAEQCEYYYRKGRVLQELGEKAAAIVSFKAALSHSDIEANYALGNSALQLGYLYERQQQQVLARQYFKKALQFKDFPFYEGIHQKAKAGLSRLRN